VLRHLAHCLRRLDPAAPPLRGGLRFRVTGLDIPPELTVQLAVTLWDPDLDDTGRGWETISGGRRIPAILGGAPLQLDQTAWVGVADGRYRLAVRPSSKTSQMNDTLGARGKLLFDRMELDFSALPEIVEVRGRTVDLPPIRAWLRE
jgi:hypothetical protein